MPVVPKPPAFDAKAFAARLKSGLGNFTVFDQFVNWKRWDDEQRGHLEALRVGVFGPGGIKRDLDDFRENVGVAHNSFDRRLDALEAASVTTPFPGSG